MLLPFLKLVKNDQMRVDWKLGLTTPLHSKLVENDIHTRRNKDSATAN